MSAASAVSPRAVNATMKAVFEMNQTPKKDMAVQARQPTPATEDLAHRPIFFEYDRFFDRVIVSERSCEDTWTPGIAVFARLDSGNRTAEKTRLKTKDWSLHSGTEASTRSTSTTK
ncbi:hypothetical protein EMPS_07819 [Entomortierella parvispora]|uniref:Uncharacterized protein n=1 Tax=Entomortierella parvispora TaxID=205924 RepID=A0A9P3LYH9_9FUNG|nr:hypothetical protein EMPS_07819 [Entomortierella parvispora]